MYTYDDMGNIYMVGHGEDINSVTTDNIYHYDTFNRLIREDNVGFNATYTYTYDDNGNITSKCVYPIGNTNVSPTTTYTYAYTTGVWKDQLARFGNTYFTYDNLGNPKNYKGNSLTWNGRQLTKFGNHTFDYDANGIRFKKNNITYSLDGDKILKETDGTNTITYYYGVNGIVGLNYNGVDYYYRKNIQGDVVEIYTASGTLAASYIYDAWGNHLVLNAYGAGNTSSTFIGNVNPIRYRGYYFDRETGLYYLQTRYYDPEIGRFISPDSLDYLDPETLGGINLYAYCNNNPVMYADPSGHLPWLILAAVLLFTPVGGTALQVAISALSYAGIAVASIFDEDIRDNMNAIGWNPFNTNELETLRSSKVSFYKGVPVFRTTTERSGSFGAIFLTRNSVENDLRHERGHNWQLMMMGIGTYGFTVGIPSPLKLGPWAKDNRYYYAPWETMADILGGINQRYGEPIPSQQIKNAWVYYAMSTICFPLTALYWL